MHFEVRAVSRGTRTQFSLLSHRRNGEIRVRAPSTAPRGEAADPLGRLWTM
jgi:hypothetical protein